MTDGILETKKQSSYQPRPRDIAVTIWITLLVLLSLDSAIFEWLPGYITGARYPLIFFLILVQSRSANRVTGIQELLILFISTTIVSIHLISSYFTKDTLFIPPETYDDAFYRIITNIIFVSVIIPWLWFAHRRFEGKIIQRILIISSAVVYPLALLAQFDSSRAELFYVFAIAFMSFWLIISSLQLKLFYSSRRNKIGNGLILTAFLSLGIPFLILAFVHNSTTITLAQLGFDVWIYILYIILTLFSEGLILTEYQTLSAVQTYYEMKSQEGDECIVFQNFDIYLRNVPEDLVRSIDDDQLTLTWIGLQRTPT